jgi:hypothetical protein
MLHAVMSKFRVALTKHVLTRNGKEACQVRLVKMSDFYKVIILI